MLTLPSTAKTVSPATDTTGGAASGDCSGEAASRIAYSVATASCFHVSIPLTSFSLPFFGTAFFIVPAGSDDLLFLFFFGGEPATSAASFCISDYQFIIPEVSAEQR